MNKEYEKTVHRGRKKMNDKNMEKVSFINNQRNVDWNNQVTVFIGENRNVIEWVLLYCEERCSRCSLSACKLPNQWRNLQLQNAKQPTLWNKFLEAVSGVEWYIHLNFDRSCKMPLLRGIQMYLPISILWARLFLSPHTVRLHRPKWYPQGTCSYWVHEMS